MNASDAGGGKEGGHAIGARPQEVKASLHPVGVDVFRYRKVERGPHRSLPTTGVRSDPTAQGSTSEEKPS